MKRFDNFISKLKKDFSARDEFCSFIPDKKKIIWPDGYGVYTIWKKTMNYENLVYVGLTGGLTRKEGKIIPNKGSFKSRSYRSSPYRFCESKKDKKYRYTFRYSPKHKDINKQAKNKYGEDSYDETISYNDLLIATFDLSKLDAHTPASLESLILTNYFKEEGDLPPANNKL
tara:strand:+ start:1100 stop:1615 length:516 start_codon:yes stop_codon:yes gene_type:complete